MKRTLIALALMAGFTTAASAMGKYEIEYVNNTPYPITAIYAKNLETGESKGDILPGTIEPGQSKVVSFDDGTRSCIWRTQVITTNSETDWIRRDVCDVGRVTINGR